MNTTLGATGIVALLLAAAALLVGVAGYVLGRSRPPAARPTARRKLPTQWPLNPRALTNTAERRIWHWLRQVFPHHHIMVKLPVTRFTMPREPGAATEWFALLSSAYCTFTICDDQGLVIGCIDLVGPRGLSRGNRQLKQTLLAQCGIGYWVIEPSTPPAAETLRTEFLGSHARDSSPSRITGLDQLDEARTQLHEALDRKRSHRQQLAGSQPTAGEDTPPGEHTGWQQLDSFMGTLDSRRTPLDKK